MKVGTDAVLLGSLSTIKKPNRILDIGTGTGVIALMLAQRSEALIDAIELIHDSAEECRKNFRSSIWSNRLNCIHGDVVNFEFGFKYDLIVSNPPFFDSGQQEMEINREVARSQVSLNFYELTRCAAELLKPSGIFSVIIPTESEEALINAAAKQNLFCFHKINVYGRKGKEASRSILEFSELSQNEKTENLTIELGERHDYSAEYLELMSDFLFLE